MLIPCGGCIGCRLQKARDWATRMAHEASLHESNSFITLTYANEYLPEDGSLSVRATQLFFKRLRKSLPGVSVRYFVVGEYGDENWRPHYHAILFGYQFPDLIPWRMSPGGFPLYRSAALEKLWPFGQCEVGNVNAKSAGYVARYSLKKVTGQQSEDHYLRPHPVTGSVHRVIPEFALMSRRPGLGDGWFKQFARDAFPSDFLVIDGKKRPVPAYYKKKLSEIAQLQVVARRKSRARANTIDSTDARLATREEVQTRRQMNISRDKIKD